MTPTASDTGTLPYRLSQEIFGAGIDRLIIFRGLLRSILQQVLWEDLKGSCLRWYTSPPSSTILLSINHALRLPISHLDSY